MVLAECEASHHDEVQDTASHVKPLADRPTIDYSCLEEHDDYELDCDMASVPCAQRVSEFLQFVENAALDLGSNGSNFAGEGSSGSNVAAISKTRGSKAEFLLPSARLSYNRGLELD